MSISSSNMRIRPKILALCGLPLLGLLAYAGFVILAEGRMAKNLERLLALAELTPEIIPSGVDNDLLHRLLGCAG